MKYTLAIFVALLLLLWSCSSQDTNTTSNWDTSSETNSWVLISEEEQNGETPSLSAFPDQAFKALGTEPFWSFSYSEQELTWSEPGEDEIIEATHFTQQVYLESENTWYITGDFISFVITEETCSDGMSDNVFEYKVTWNYFEKELNGCAEIL